MAVIIAMSITACKNPIDPKPEVDTIKEICELETLTVECNDVVKAVKKAGEGKRHFLEKDRVYWVEYTGIVQMGVNAEKATIDVKNDKVYISLPEAEVFDVHVEEGSITKDSIFISNDSFFNRNPITAEDQTKVMKKAQKQLEEAFEENKEMKEETTMATKKAIEKYVEKLGESFDTDYKIIWR